LGGAHPPPHRATTAAAAGARQAAAATAGAAGRGSEGKEPEFSGLHVDAAADRKKRLTVPKSPNFSKFSWQQNGGLAAGVPPAAQLHAAGGPSAAYVGARARNGQRAAFGGGGGAAPTRRF
jgi:hypothetical protein